VKERKDRAPARTVASLPALLMLAASWPALAQDVDASSEASVIADAPDAATGAPPEAANAPATYATIPLADAPPEAPRSTPAPVAGIEEVIVTARRTAESLQDVPVAISAMSAADLQREQINTPQDLQGRVPSLVVGANSQMRNTESPTIRGQGAQFGASPGVVIYMGEVALPSDPVANNQGGPGKFFDLSRLEILKGSQGTLFGRNTTGGAMLLEPTRPENSFFASLRAGVSNYSGQSYEGVLNVPLLDDTLLLRVGGQFFDREGFTRDVVTGKDYDSKHYWSTRLGLTWRPTDRVENYLLGYYTDSEDNGTATVIEGINREGINQAIPAAVGLDVLSRIPGLDLTQVLNLGCIVMNLFGPSANCGRDILAEQAARDHRKVQLDGDPNDILKTGAVIDQFRYELTDELTLRNIASYSSLRHHYRWDLDGSRAAFNQFDNADPLNQANIDTYTEELQLQGHARDGRLKFVLGGYYERTKATGDVTASSLFIERIYQGYEQNKESYAPFAQATYDLGDLFDSLSGLNLTLGARYTWDKTSGTATLTQKALDLIALVDNTHDAEVRDSALTYTAGLDYKLGGSLLYGKISRGYKTGGMSVIVVNPAHYTYKPEFVTNYELGQKSDFEIAGMPVRLNTAAYYTKYDDLQKAGPDSYIPPNSVSPLPQLGQAVFNVGQAWVAGFELDATIRPFPGFTFIGTYGYTRGEYKKFDLLYGGATPQLDCTGQLKRRGDTLQLSCIPYEAPEQQFSVSARYLMPIDPELGDVEIGATYAWTDRRYSAQTTLPEDEPGAWLPAYGLLNASISWRRVFGTALDVQLYGTNLTDEQYRIANSNQWHLTYIRSSIYSEPRIVGLQLGYSWGG